MKLDMRFAWTMLRIFALLVTIFYVAQNGVNLSFLGYCVACIFTWAIALYNEKKLAVKEN